MRGQHQMYQHCVMRVSKERRSKSFKKWRNDDWKLTSVMKSINLYCRTHCFACVLNQTVPNVVLTLAKTLLRHFFMMIRKGKLGFYLRSFTRNKPPHLSARPRGCSTTIICVITRNNELATVNNLKSYVMLFHPS